MHAYKNDENGKEGILVLQQQDIYAWLIVNNRS